ncbi:MAG TPA: autotransporter-associated beta strand repeat-containing protein [Kiritimatiellia bacterium]|nr:autotransporter-associated beta strand repeat-containing protein [Kiritimatiellia bacterium]
MKTMSGWMGRFLAVWLSVWTLDVRAADTAWTGAVDDDWNNVGNWSLKVPAVGDSVYFTNMPSTSVRVTANSGATLMRIYMPLTLTLESGVTLSLSNTGSEVLTSTADVTIDGPGTLSLSTSSGDNHADVRPAAGTILTINAKVTGSGTSGFEHNGLGKIVLNNPANDFPGTVALTGNSGSIGSTLEFSDVGALGNAPAIRYGNYYTAVRYLGGTATLNKNILVATGSNTGRDINFYNAGTGALTINGKVDSVSDTGKAILFNAENPAGSFVLNGAVTNTLNALYLYSSGKGNVTVNGPVSIKGQLRSMGTSTLIMNGDATATTGSYQADAGTTFILADDAILGNNSFNLSAAGGTAPGGSLIIRDSARTGTGTLTLNAGTSLSLSESAALSNATVTVNTTPGAINTCRIALNASGASTSFDVRVPTMTINGGGVVKLDIKPATAGSGTLSVNTVNIPAGATLETTATGIGTDAARVFAANFPEGAVSQRVFINGFPSSYSALNGFTAVVPSDPVAPDVTLAGIPALGPYSITSTSGTADIDTQGTGGPLTIGESLTSLGTLRQTWSGDAALLDLAGNTLATPLIQIAASGNSLTLTNGVVSAPGLPPAGEPPVNQPALIWLSDDASAGITNNGTRIFTHLLDFGNQGPANAARLNGLLFTKTNSTYGTVIGTDSQTYRFSGFPPVFNGASWNNWTNPVPAGATGLRALLYDMSYAGASFNFTLSNLTAGATYELRLFNRSWDGLPSTTQRTQTLSFISDPDDPNPPTFTFDQNNLPANVLVVRYVPTGDALTVRSLTASGTSNPYQGVFGLSNERISDTAVGVPAVTRVSTLALDNQNAAATLTLAAQVTDNAGPLGLRKTGAGAASVADAQFNGNIALLGGSLALGTPAGTTNLLQGTISGVAGASLVKTGDGVLRLAAPNAYLGPTVVQSGTLALTAGGALGADGNGNPASGTVIQPGAALDFNGVSLGSEHLSLGGAGPDGNGVVLNSSGRSPANSSAANVLLTSDVTVGGSGVVDFRYGTLDFGGHSLTKVGNGQLHLGYLAANNVGEATAIDVQQGMLMLADGTSLTGSVANVINLRNGASLGFYNTVNPLLWSVVVADGATGFINVGSGTATNVNLYAGPVTIGTGSTLAISNSSTAVAQTFSGPISGPGSLTRVAGSAGETYLRGTNTYAGTTTVYGGGLHAFGPWALSGYDQPNRVFSSSWLYTYMQGPANPCGWTVSEVGTTLMDNADLTGLSTLALVLNANIVYPYDIANDTRFFLRGAYTADLNGHFTYPNNATNGGIGAQSSAIVGVHSDQSDYYVGYVLADGGTLNFTNAFGSIIRSATGSDITVQNNGVLNLSGGNTLVGHVKTYNSGGGKSIYGPNGKGVINITNGATLQGKLYIGINSNSTYASTAIYVDGGTLHNTGGAGNDSRIGHQGYGYIQLDAGTVTNNGYTQLGSHFPGVGILRQNGGTFSFAGGTASTETGYYGGSFAVSRGGTGVLHVAGGAFNSYSALTIGELSDNGGVNGLSVMTVEGTGNVNVPYINTANRTNHLSVINLNGGDLSARYILRSNRTGNESRVNLNGTVINPQVEVSAPFFHNDTGVNPPDTRVWPGSACFNVTNVGILTRLITPLRAPEGNGIQSITLSANGSGYNAPPHVNIFGGGGSGATAISLINRALGQVTNIVVTSPGTGYTTNPVVTLTGGGGSGATVGTIVRGLNPTTGGLVKTGDGTLALLGSGSTYGGPTVVNGGTLLVGAQDALSPLSSAIQIGDGTLDLGGRTVTNASVTLSGSGRIVNGELLSSRVVKTGSGAATLDTGVTLVPPTSATYGRTPGLLEGMIASAWNTNQPNPVISTQLTTRAGNGIKTNNTYYAGGLWAGNNHTWIYSGYLWNRGTTNVAWTFRGTFDDNVRLVIDGDQQINAGQTEVRKNVTLKPGPHAIEIRFGDGTGNVGPSSGLGGLTYDPLGRNSGNAADYLLLTDPGDGSLLTVDDGGASGLPVDPIIQVDAGTLLIPPAARTQPGLYEGRVSGNQNWIAANPKDLVTPNIRSATGYVSSGGTLNGAVWPDNTTYIHSGYLWNREPTNVVWTFGENFDDTALLYIDGVRVLYDTASATPTYKNVTLTPGPHAFELRLAQGSGSVGGNWVRSDSVRIGFGVDRQGRNANVANNYEPLVDPGDGSLFTLTPDSGDTNLLNGVTVNLAASATLNLGGVPRAGLTVTGEGLVSNAVFAAGAVLSPAGDAAVGTLALDHPVFAGATTYRVNIAADNDLVDVAGPVDLTQLTVVPADGLSAAPAGTSYVILRASGGFTGAKPALSGFDSKWKLIRFGNDLILTSQKGLVLMFN